MSEPTRKNRAWPEIENYNFYISTLFNYINYHTCVMTETPETQQSIQNNNNIKMLIR